MGIKRFFVQMAAAIIANPFIDNLFKGRIYQGNAKYICVPGLNCYSCPSAIGSCPIGALQTLITSKKEFFYVHKKQDNHLFDYPAYIYRWLFITVKTPLT